MNSSTLALAEHQFITGLHLPDSALVREVTELIRDTESPLLFNHCSRVFCFASVAGEKSTLKFDPELLYVAAMFHDMGLVSEHSSASDRFEVDGANAARDFLESHQIAEADVDHVWTAIALHTTPGIPQYMHPIVALLTTGVELDVLGIGLSELDMALRHDVLRKFPRTEHFKEEIIQAFYDGIKHKPATTFGNVKADVLADKDPRFSRINFCSMIRESAWEG